MHEYAEITHFKHTNKGTELLVTIPKKSIGEQLQRFSQNGIVKAEIHLDDGRTISAEQRKKAYATIRDIALHTGHIPEELKEILKYYYMAETGEQYFSLSNCSMTTAKEYINYLIEFCLRWNIPLKESGLERTDDINTYLYMCLRHKKCCICGLDGEIHHWEAIGMGHDRKNYDDSNNEKIALCRKHHTEVHAIGRDAFAKKYKVYGIIFNE